MEYFPLQNIKLHNLTNTSAQMFVTKTLPIVDRPGDEVNVLYFSCKMYEFCNVLYQNC